MPSSPVTTLQTDTLSEYFNTSAYMDMETYFDLQSAGDSKSPQINTAPNSPPLNPQYRTSPILWNGVRGSPRFHNFTTSLSDLGVGSPQTGISPLQTTIEPDNFMGNPSPPNSSESSPNKYAPPGDISPLDSLIVNMPESSRTVHGQVTPPEDSMNSPNLEPLHHSLTLSMRLTPPGASPILSPRSTSPRQQHTSGSENTTRESGRKRRSSTAQSSSRKQRKSLSVEELPEVQEAKRKRFLERNRVAASKCRQKKKAWMQDLETEAREAQNMSKQLKLCVGMFKEEILQLKNELLKHNTCDCTPIRQYLSNEAIRLAEVGAGAGSLGMNKTARPSDASQYSFTTDSEPKLGTSEFELDFIGT
ncbi:hypothetical protein EDC01DRAFT_657708 [Geopyxis carbonaria]|nr:hypothetical protein EDC01DRAFT_657708 [Geopyxis carbonaria]